MDNFIKLIEKEIDGKKIYDLDYIQNQIELLFNLIQKSESVEEAEQTFKVLEDIHFVLARAIFKNGLEVNKFLRQFVYDFDRIDDNELKKHLFNKIKLKEYPDN